MANLNVCNKRVCVLRSCMRLTIVKTLFHIYQVLPEERIGNAAFRMLLILCTYIQMLSM